MALMTVLEYQTADGHRPYREWFETLDNPAAARIAARIERLVDGNFGDWKAVGEGVFEMRVHFGAGYRVYFGRDGRAVVILLCGGSKRSQVADIKQAKLNWKDYENAK